MITYLLFIFYTFIYVYVYHLFIYTDVSNYFGNSNLLGNHEEVQRQVVFLIED